MNTKFFQVCFYFFRLFWSDCKVSVRLPLAQAVHESANFTSSLYKRTNNMLGMNYPAKRATTAIGKDAGFAVYRSPVDSIRDYFKWLDYWKIKTDDQLTAFLSKGYAADPNYLKKVNALANELQPSLLPQTFVASLAAGLTLSTVYAAYRGLDYSLSERN